MRKLNVVTLLSLCVAMVPAVAIAGNGETGACYVVGGLQEAPPEWIPEGKFSFAGCADGFTEEECTSADELTLFAPGFTCADVALKGGFEWQGSCQADIDPVGTTCILLWSDLGLTGTQALCENDIGGMWFADLTCGAPVPTMPGFGMAAMALLILAGALILLTVRGSLH